MLTNEEATKKILNREVSLIDLTTTESSDYIRGLGETIEEIEGRTRVAFVRCPRCREYVGVYKDEIDSLGRIKLKKHYCGFYKSIILKNW